MLFHTLDVGCHLIPTPPIITRLGEGQCDPQVSLDVDLSCEDCSLDRTQ